MVLLLTTAGVVSAQSAGTFEITGFGRFTRFDDTLRIQEELGGGGSLGFYLLPILALEAEAWRQMESPRTQVASKGFGSAVPIAPNTTAAGRAQNRRVELHRNQLGVERWDREKSGA
jgi:hypothetical protein